MGLTCGGESLLVPARRKKATQDVQKRGARQRMGKRVSLAEWKGERRKGRKLSEGKKSIEFRERKAHPKLVRLQEKVLPTLLRK